MLMYLRVDQWLPAMCGLLAEYANDRLWLKADLQSPEIEVRSSPNSRHSAAPAGRPITRPLRQSIEVH